MYERKSPLVRWCRLIPQPSDLVFALMLLFVLIGRGYGLFAERGSRFGFSFPCISVDSVVDL
jgi:hypothetical protein